MKQKRRIITVRWKSDRPYYSWFNWLVSEAEKLVERAHSKKEAVTLGAGECRDIVREGGRAQLRVYNKNGRIAFERTYPRSSDPKRSKG